MSSIEAHERASGTGVQRQASCMHATIFRKANTVTLNLNRYPGCNLPHRRAITRHIQFNKEISEVRMSGDFTYIFEALGGGYSYYGAFGFSQ